MARLAYNPSLDGLRGIAILAVFVHHIESLIYSPEPGYFSGGALGVDIFFVLSGFLITTLLLKEWQQTNRISLKAF